MAEPDELSDDVARRLASLADTISDYWEMIEQDVPLESYIVGGAVRDTILGLEPNDYDFVVVGESPTTMENYGFERIPASSFPVYHDSEHNEWALARTEQSTGGGHDDFVVNTNDVSLADDLNRRDITMNAMALDPDSVGLSLYDPFNGVEDIRNNEIDAIHDSFAEDPIRILRVARYAARYQMSVSEQTYIRMRSNAHKLNRCSRDRIGDEIVTALEEARMPRHYFDVLRAGGALAVLWPDLDRSTAVLAGPEQHHAEGSVYEHTMLVVERMNDLCDEYGIDGIDKVRRLAMAVAHDIGKVAIADNSGGIHSDDPPTRFGGHDERGVELVREQSRRLGIPHYIRDAMADACELHMLFYNVPDMPAAELVETLDTFPLNESWYDGRELSETSAGNKRTLYGATVWELIDICHADHEGRLEYETSDCLGEPERPTFDPEPYERAVRAVAEAQDAISGYDALERGLCDEHSDVFSDDYTLDGVVGDVMEQCSMCRTPSDWVGKTKTELVCSYVNEHR